MIAITLSFRLRPMACQSSYPLNSDIASPPGTFAAYLSCAAMAMPARTASQTVAIPMVNRLLRFIRELLSFFQSQRDLTGPVPMGLSAVDSEEIDSMMSSVVTRALA